VQKKVFNYCLKVFQQSSLIDWNWHLQMLDIATRTIASKKDAKKIHDLLDEYLEYSDEYEDDEVQVMRLQLIQSTEGEAAANAFIQENLSTNPLLRSIAIETAFKDQDYEKAKQLANDGIKQDKAQGQYFRVEWYNWLLKISIEINDSIRIIEYARNLLINYKSEKEQLYWLLKQHVSKKEWPLFLEKLIEDIANTSPWLSSDSITMIYEKEGDIEQLFHYLKTEFLGYKISLDYLMNFEKQLSSDYSKELAELYVIGINTLLNENTGRNYYKSATYYIQGIIKIGEVELAKELIALLVKKFANRPALLEELQALDKYFE